MTGTGSAMAVDNTGPSLSHEYQDDFVMGTFGGWSGAQEIYHYRTSSPSNALKLDSQIGNSSTNSLSRQTYVAAVAAIEADASLDEVQKADAIERANENVILQSTTASNQSEGILRAIQEYNRANNLPEAEKKVVRAHVLAWHGGQQPNYFFTNGFTYDAANPDWASTQTMLKRLDNYIQKMMVKYAPYNDIIYSWDVVNEPVDDFSGQIRNGEDAQPGQWGRIFRRTDLDSTPDARLYAESAWVRQAFASARKWSNANGATWKLYLNDFQDSNKLYEPKMSQTIKLLEPIYAAGNIDGYGMQGRLAWAYPTIDMLTAQVEAGLTVADEISVSESDIRSDFEPNPDYDPAQPTRKVTLADLDDPSKQWPAYGSCSWTYRASVNGNTFDVCNSPVRRIPAWGTGGNDALATSPDIMKKQADFAADWMDVLLSHKGKVVAYQFDGTNDTRTFNRNTGGHLWAGTTGNPEKYSFFSVIGAPNREKMRDVIATIDPADQSLYSSASWSKLVAAEQAAQDLIDVRIYTLNDVNTVKSTTAALKAAIRTLHPQEFVDLYGAWSDADLSIYTATTASALRAALDGAATTLANPAPADGEITAAHAALSAAVANLVKLATTSQKSLLRSIIALAAKSEANQAAYSPASYAPFADALAAARTVLGDPQASGPDTQSAISTLSSTLAALAPAVDTSALSALIGYVQGEILAHPEHYLSAGIGALTDQVALAQATLAKPDLTDADVLAAAQALMNALAGVVDKGDTTALAAFVQFVDGLSGTAYTTTSWNGIVAPLAGAKTILALPEVSVDQVDQAYTALSGAVDGLVVRASKGGLASAINLAQVIVDSIDRYAPSSVAGLPAALASANTVYTNGDATQGQVTEAQNTLMSQVYKARFKAVTTALRSAIATAEAVNVKTLTQPSATKLTTELKLAKTLFSDVNALQETVDQNASGLLTLVSNLIYQQPAGIGRSTTAASGTSSAALAGPANGESNGAPQGTPIGASDVASTSDSEEPATAASDEASSNASDDASDGATAEASTNGDLSPTSSNQTPLVLGASALLALAGLYAALAWRRRHTLKEATPRVS